MFCNVCFVLLKKEFDLKSIVQRPKPMYEAAGRAGRIVGMARVSTVNSLVAAGLRITTLVLELEPTAQEDS